MKTHFIISECQDGTTLDLGLRGENLVKQFTFDFSSWVEDYGAGTITLWRRDSISSDPYIVPCDISGTVLTWTVKASDIQTVGNGMIEFFYTTERSVVKSCIFKTVVRADIMAVI